MPDLVINDAQFEALVDAIKHPVVQVRPLGELAQKVIEDYAKIARSLRTVFVDAPDSSTHTNY